MVKNNIRKSLLERGQLLSEKFIIDANNEIQSTAINKINLKESLNNLLYFPFRKEITLDYCTLRSEITVEQMENLNSILLKNYRIITI